MNLALLDIGGTEIKAARLSLTETALKSGVVLPALTDKLSVPTDASKGGPAVMEKAKGLLQSMAPFDCIGISTAGQVDFKTGHIRYANANIPGYTGFPVREFMAKAFSCPVSVENDVNAAALGELHFGVGQIEGLRDFLCLTVGTGIGGAVLQNGHLLRGVYGCAGEFGATVTHADVRLKLRAEDEMAGCFERYASTTALVREASLVDASLTNGRILFTQLHRQEIQGVLDAWLDELAMGLTTLVHILNPSAVVLGGGIMKESLLLPKLEKKLSEQIFPSFQPLRLYRAALGNDAGLWGAAALALGLVGEA